MIEQIFQNRLNSLQDYLNFIIESNEPNILPDGNFEKLLMIAADNQLIPPGLQEPMLKPNEVQLLSIRKGSLNDRERIEIESHVTHTFHFSQQNSLDFRIEARSRQLPMVIMKN